MTAEPVTAGPSSRRAILAGALGAAVASVASVLGRPMRVKAADGDNVLLGQTNYATESTKISATGFGIIGESSGFAGVVGTSTAVTGVVQGVTGSSESTSGWGVSGTAFADSGQTRGVYGIAFSKDGTGVYGLASAASGLTNGVFARVDSPGGTAVVGFSSTNGFDADPSPVAKTGVYGYAAQDAGSRGVYGRSTAGRGVYGQATAGQGVRGQATTGAAVYGATTDPKNGYGLRALGRVRLDHSAGIATILSGTNSIVVTPGIDLVATSAVTATLQGNPGGTAMVRSVAVNAMNDTFTIYLTANATANVKVAWHVFG